MHGGLHQSRRLEMNLEPSTQFGVVVAEHQRVSASVTLDDRPSTDLLYSEPLAQFLPSLLPFASIGVQVRLSLMEIHRAPACQVFPSNRMLIYPRVGGSG